MMPSAAPPAEPASRSARTSGGRLEHLDVLRGLALFGMFVVHLSWYSQGVGPVSDMMMRITLWGFSTKFFALFAFLFGIGFAIQLLAAEARGERFLLRYSRRLSALLLLALPLKILLGFRVLLLYAIWGFALLLFRHAGPRVIIAGVVVCVLGSATAELLSGAWLVYEEGSVAAAEVVLQSRHADLQAVLTHGEAVRDTGSYLQVVRSRMDVSIAEVSRLSWWIPAMQPLGFFLLGLLAVRGGIVHRPFENRHIIVRSMLFGAVVTFCALMLYSVDLPGRVNFAYTATERAFGAAVAAVNTQFFVFVYIGIAVLWAGKYLRPLRWAGRMALTNYVAQLLFLEGVLGRHGLGMVLPSATIIPFALLFIVFHIGTSWWWLRRYRFGPLEWVWRMVTYARWEPLRRHDPQQLRIGPIPVVPGESV